ncbi:MAG: S8/S53 family peptidase [Thiothrix sp.]|nr:S8/S53 family peptidase [Thiothrix sp.]HPQ97011.1 S8/S53 family peptidase [Thiolinea sp.]
MRWNTLLLVESTADVLLARIHSDPAIFRFKRLPLIALEAGHPWADAPPSGLRAITFTPTGYAVAWCINRTLLEADHLSRTWAPNGNRWVPGLTQPPGYVAMAEGSTQALRTLPLTEPVRLAHPVALALSLQLRQQTRMGDDHVLGIATRFAAQAMPVLVAAGNWGRFGTDTLSPLAALPWTLAVGATADPEGRELHPASSTGTPGSAPGTGVTVVAYGEDAFAPGVFGTSFAVPRAITCLMLLTAFMLQLRAIAATRRNGRLGGIPLLQHLTVDRGFAGFDTRPSLPLPMLPRLGVNHDQVIAALETLEAAGFPVQPEPDPAVMRRMLIASARPMPRYQAHETGFGFVSETTTTDYLAGFTGLELARLFIRSPLPASLCATLRACRLANAAGLPALNAISRDSALSYAMDYATGAIHASMRDPGLNPQESGFHREPGHYTWPPRKTVLPSPDAAPICPCPPDLQ